MTAADQPAAGVALIRWLRTEAAKNKKKRSEVTHGAHFVTRARKLNQAADFIETAIRTPASGPVEADVRRLVIAARVVAFEDQSPEALKALDKASEAFASVVPWDDEPEGEFFEEVAR